MPGPPGWEPGNGEAGWNGDSGAGAPDVGPPGTGPGFGNGAVGEDDSGAAVLPPGDEVVDQESAAANATVTPEAAVSTVDSGSLSNNSTILN